MKKYKQIISKENMIVNQIYVGLNKTTKTWDALAKDKHGVIWALATDNTKKIQHNYNLEERIGSCVLAVYNSITYPKQRDAEFKRKSKH